MTEKSKKSASTGQEAPVQHSAPVAKPDWANGLRRLYDSVVEEPLPDSFKDLLAKLDSSDT